MKKYFLAVMFFVFLVINANASMVSFFIIETGLPQNDTDNQHSITWENAFMDVFFDSGYIVSNSPIIRLNSKPNGDILSSISFNLTEARNMGMDFLLIAHIDYNSDNSRPESISFTIYRVFTREKLMENNVQVRTYRSSRDEYEDIKTIIRGLLPYFGG